jgi:catechol 2,3-dioxygenase-like lactoylglutathione lyase family enzyme
MTQLLPKSAKAGCFIVTRDRAKAKEFYGGVLGFPQKHEDGFAVVYDLNGISLRISTVKDYKAAMHTVLGWEVQDIESAVNALTAKGILFNRYPGFEQDALGIWTAPGTTNRIAWFNDPDGNNLSLAQL